MPPPAAARRLLYLAADHTPYLPQAFLEDTRAAQGLADGADAEVAFQRIRAHFWEKYAPHEAGPRYLRFGAVQSAIGAHWQHIAAARLDGRPEEGHVASALLVRLLACPVAVDAETREAWIPPEDVRAAIGGAGVRAQPEPVASLLATR